MTSKNNDLWQVYDFCESGYVTAIDKAAKAQIAGDYEVYLEGMAEANAFRRVQDLISDIFHNP